MAASVPSSLERVVGGWTTAAAAERTALRDALRVRRSVDCFARGWYGGLATLVLTALWFAGTAGTGAWHAVSAGYLALGLGLVVAWAAVLSAFFASRQQALREASMLARLAALDALRPPPPELF